MKLIYPSESNAVGGAGVFQGKECKQLREYQLATLLHELHLSPLASFVVSGFGLTIDTGLNITIAAGAGIIEGRHVENTAAESCGVSNSVTNYIYLTLGFSGSLASTLTITSNTTGVAPAYSVCLGMAIAAGGSVTSVADAVATPTIVEGSYAGAGGTAARTIFLGFRPKLITIWGIYQASTNWFAMANSGEGSSPGVRIFTDDAGVAGVVVATDPAYVPMAVTRGFQVNNNTTDLAFGWNRSGVTYYYRAFA